MSDEIERLVKRYKRWGYTPYWEMQGRSKPTPITYPQPDPKKVGASGSVRRDLHWHMDDRGGLMEVFRQSWFTGPVFRGTQNRIGQAYISVTRPGVVKAWHAHTKQTDRFVCVRGAVMLGLYDLRRSRKSWRRVDTIVLDSQRSPKTVEIPPGVAHGWMALDHSDGEAWILNLCSHEYDGLDEWRREAHDGPAIDVHFDWRKSVDG